MLVCYLDDSGTDAANRVITCAGYISRAEQWIQFETEVEPLFSKAGVNVFHAMEMEKSSGIYKEWGILKKQAFVAGICRTLSEHALIGVSMSALKETYKSRAAESGRKRTVTAYSFCANRIVDWIMTDIRIGRIAHEEGVSFIFEDGNNNNHEVAKHIDSLRRLHKDFDAAFRAISFVPKTHSRAIQMADLLAYYSRRHGARMENGHITLPASQRNIAEPDPDIMIKIITERLPHKGFVATDFGPHANGARFFSQMQQKPWKALSPQLHLVRRS